MNKIVISGQVDAGHNSRPAVFVNSGTSKNGNPFHVAKFTLMEQTGEFQGQPTFQYIEIEAWDHEEYLQFLNPGATIEVTGTLATRHFVNKENVKVFVKIIKVTDKDHFIRLLSPVAAMPSTAQQVAQQVYQGQPAPQTNPNTGLPY